MLELPQMVLRLVFAMALGALIGLEREIIGKEAGVRTGMMVSAGSSILTIANLVLPHILQEHGLSLDSGIGFAIVANIVTGVGFLGAGIIIKNAGDSHIHGLTTAAVVWTTASIGILSGLGLFAFAVISSILLAGILYLLREVDFGHK